MKLYISVDMEGLAGITHSSQEKEEKERFRQALHNQVSWVIEGVCACSRNHEISEITIADSHGSGTNLSYDVLSDLDERISLVSGSPRNHFMMACLDDTYDVVFLVGYHAGPGEPQASMDHSFYGKVVHNLYINGEYQNETTANAALAGEYGVPVGLVIGDSGLYHQLIDQKMLPWVEFVTTKESISRYSAKFSPQPQLKQNTVNAVKKVLDSDLSSLPLYKVQTPCKLQIHFNNTALADMVALIPTTVREDGRSVSIICANMYELENAISALTALASVAQ